MKVMSHFQFLVFDIFTLKCNHVFLLVVEEMRSTCFLYLLLHAVVLALLSVSLVQAEDGYKYFTWTVTYGTLSPLGTPQQVCNRLAILNLIKL